MDDLLAKALVLAAQAIGFRRPRHQVKQVPGLERLFDEVDGALADRGDRGVEVAVAGDHQHRQARVVALDFLQQLEAV